MNNNAFCRASIGPAFKPAPFRPHRRAARPSIDDIIRGGNDRANIAAGAWALLLAGLAVITIGHGFM